MRLQTLLLSFIIYEKINSGLRRSVRLTVRSVALPKYEIAAEQSELSISTTADNSSTGSIARIRFRAAYLDGVVV